MNTGYRSHTTTYRKFGVVLCTAQCDKRASDGGVELSVVPEHRPAAPGRVEDPSVFYR